MAKTLLHNTPWMAVNQADEKTVEIDITGVIGGSFWDMFEENDNSKNTREKMKAELKALSEIKAQKIIVNIDSPGGDVAHGLSIHDMLVQHPAEIETRMSALTASIATIIAQAGNVRKMSDNSLILIHRASNFAMGNAKELQAQVEFLNAIDTKLVNIYTKKGAKEEDINALMDEDNGNGKWIDGNEAKAIGLIDEVFEPTMRAAAVYDQNLFNKLKYPVIPLNMTKKADETVSLWEQMKQAFNAVFMTADNKAEIPQDVTDRLAAFGKQLDELKAENTSLSTELETAKNEVTLKDSKITEITASLEAQKTDYEKKAKEATDLIAELKNRVNKWEPAGRAQGANGQNKVDGIDLNKVKEIQEKINKE